MARDPKLTVVVDADTGGLHQQALEVAGGDRRLLRRRPAPCWRTSPRRPISSAVDLGTEMLNQASALQQSTGAVSAVFGQHASEVEASAKKAADAVGLSANAYQELATVIGSQLKNGGTPLDQIAGKTDKLIQLGADLAATYGGSVADAVDSVSSLLRGERDPIEKYGVSINQATINAWELANGLDGATGSAKTAADQQAALALLYDQTAAAQGSFASESDTLAGAQQRLNAKWEDAQAALGEGLLPLFTWGVGVLSDFATWAQNNADVLSILIPVIVATTAAAWLLNIALDANPISLIIIAIGLLIAAFVLLITNWDSVVAAFTTGFEEIGHWFDDFKGWVDDAIGWIGDLFSKAGSLGNLPLGIGPTVFTTLTTAAATSTPAPRPCPRRVARRPQRPSSARTGQAGRRLGHQHHREWRARRRERGAADLVDPPRPRLEAGTHSRGRRADVSDA